MLFPEEDAPLLKAWIVKRIENTSDADSDVLAEYVIALLKHDGERDTVRKLCEQEIPDFLTEEPKAFLDDVFQAIQYKSYLPGAPPPPPPAQAEAQMRAVSRKRPFADQVDSADAGGGQRSHKQPRRGGRQALDDNGHDRQEGFPAMGLPPPPLGMPQLDLSDPMQAMMQMQAMGIPFPSFPNYPPLGLGGRGRRNQPRRRGRCRDFDTKGYCSRGSTCTYDHGNESISLPLATSRDQEYDHSDAVMHMSTLSNMANSFNPDTNRGRGGRRGRGNGSRGGGRGGARAPLSAEGPVHDRSKSTIVVENIPVENLDQDKIRGFFSQFGNIIHVSMQPHKRLAVVKYDNWAAANDAYRSPKVIFDNRFVKVFWYKDEKDAPPLPAPLNEANGPSCPDVDMDEFHKKQQEAQKQHCDRESRKVELEQQRQALEQQQQQLLAKHQAETERLRLKLTGKNDGDSNSASSGTGILRAQLAALEEEAKILGIDPNAAGDGGMVGSRGGYRGRRGFRGRVGFAPRGRGSFRGQGARHATYAQYSIDNRPRRVAVTGVDFTPAERDEVLRHYLLNLGEFESVETTPSVTHVSFQDRRTAEKFYYSLHEKELPGVEGKLDLAWVNMPPPLPVSARKRPGDSPTAASEDGMAGTGIEDMQETSGDGPGPPRVLRQVDMDYEVGDDDAWGEGIQ